MRCSSYVLLRNALVVVLIGVAVVAIAVSFHLKSKNLHKAGASDTASERIMQHKNGSVLHYLRNPKTGSTSMLKLLRALGRTNSTCRAVTSHGHAVFSWDKSLLGQDTFTVLRNPCERFVSQWSHFRRGIVGKHQQLRISTCHRFFDPKVLESPMAWGEFLLSNESAKDAIFNATAESRLTGGFCMPMIVKPQSTWVGPETALACLPSLAEDLSRILGCDVTDVIHRFFSLRSKISL